MRTTTARVYLSKTLWKSAGVLLLLPVLASLIGCQGLSAGGSSQQQTSLLTLETASVNFGSVATGTGKTVTVTATNSGTKAITVSGAAVSNKYFSLTAPGLPASIPAGQSTALTVKFTPNAPGTFSGTVSLTSDASNTVTNLSLAGTGVADGQLMVSPASEAFGSVTVGSKQSQAVTLTNNSSASVNISQASVSGAGFQLSGITTPLTLNSSQSATFTISFAPQATGSASGTVTITSNAPNPTLTMALSGTGTTATGQLTVAPTTLGLGSVVVGTSGTASGSLTASGANVTVTAATSNNSVFSVGGLSLPVTIPAGQSVPFTVTFSPQTSGALGATLIFASNAQPSTTTEALTGTGTPAPTHAVNLSWNASTSSNISGYNVYRAVYVNSCGSFAKINAVLNTGTLYTDSAVVSGTFYCYATTAVNSSNEESGYSNVVSNVHIPSP